VLAALRTVFLLVPTVFTVVTGNDLPTSAWGRVFLGLFGAALAAYAGFVFRARRHQTPGNCAAVLGALTLGVTATVEVLTSTGYREDHAPGRLVVNLVINGVLVVETGDVPGLGSVCHPDIITHSLSASMPQGIEGTRRFVASRKATGGVGQWDDVASVAEGEYVVRFRTRGFTWPGGPFRGFDVPKGVFRRGRSASRPSAG
jgi:hypothetical protein